MSRAITLLLVLAPALAAADPVPSPITIHANGGLELMGGPDAFSAAFRGHVGLGTSFGEHGVQPAIALGATWGLGALSVSDPRALDGSLSIGYADYGPELQVGVRFANGGVVDSRVFASVAYLHTRLDDRLMLDSVPGVGGDAGVRATLGASWPDRIHYNHESDDADHFLYGWTIYLLPEQVELGWERSAGSDRFGVTLGWGI